MIEWWKGLSKTSKYLTYMGLAFGPLMVMGILQEMGVSISMWVMIPVLIIGMNFACMAYAIRVSS